MSVFDVDIDQTVTANLPARMRQPVFSAWLRCLLAPAYFLKGLFDAARAADLYELSHNGQVCFLEAALNDVFDTVGRSITISDPPYCDFLTAYLVAEIPPRAAINVYLHSETVPAGTHALLPLFTAAEVGVDDNCFVVQVPATLGLSSDQILRLRALVDKYRLPGKNNYSVRFV
jgi:hypothetical protein